MGTCPCRSGVHFRDASAAASLSLRNRSVFSSRRRRSSSAASCAIAFVRSTAAVRWPTVKVRLILETMISVYVSGSGYLVMDAGVSNAWLSFAARADRPIEPSDFRLHLMITPRIDDRNRDTLSVVPQSSGLGEGAPRQRVERPLCFNRPRRSECVAVNDRRRAALYEHAIRRRSTMGTNDTNATPEQRRPADVHPTPSNPEPADDESKAPPAVQPSGEKDESERPIVNPVTGAPM